MYTDIILLMLYYFNKERSVVKNVCVFALKRMKLPWQKKSFIFAHIGFKIIPETVIKTLGPEVMTTTGDYCV